MNYNLMMAIFCLGMLGYLAVMSHLGAYITERKGRGDILGAALGCLLGLIGVVIALLIPAKRQLTGNARDDAAIKAVMARHHNSYGE